MASAASARRVWLATAYLAVALAGCGKIITPERTMAGPAAATFRSMRRPLVVGECLARAWDGPNAVLPAFRDDGSVILAFDPNRPTTVVLRATPTADGGSLVTVWEPSRKATAEPRIAKCRDS